MKYYVMCKKLLGQKQFDELIKHLTNQIIKKFSSDIFLDSYMKILEYNIRLLIIISIGDILKLNEEEKAQKISFKENKKYLIYQTLIEFEENNKFFINKITKLLK